MLGQVDTPDLRLLRVFRSVARRGGLVAAQTELNTSLSTISLQMKQLEDRLGVRLCDRGAAGFRLTPQGEAVLQATDKLFAALGDFRNEIGEVAKVPIGEVRLGIIDNLIGNPACHVSEAIDDLQSNLEGVGISFFIGAPSDIESEVLSGSLDMAIGMFSKRHPSLRYVALFQEEHCLYCARSHPLFQDAETFDMAALREADYVSWSYLEPYVTANSPLQFSIRSASPYMDGVACLILAGRDIGFLPRFFAQQWVDRGILRALRPAELSRRLDIVLICRKAQPMKRVVNLLYAALLKAHHVTADEHG